MLKLDLQFFGGRGASSGGGGGGDGGGGATGELGLPDGTKVEFEGTLHFDGDDKTLTADQRRVITEWEDKRYKNKVEYAYAVDENGNPIGREIKGGKGSVRTPYAYHDTPNGTFSHVHPREDGVLGGTFSDADMKNFANHRGRTIRATAKEGTYSMSKGSGFDKDGFKKYVATGHGEFKATNRRLSDAVYQRYKSGQITYAEYKLGAAKAFNTALVGLHEHYRKGQQNYGYTYTLEGRK